MTAQPQWPRFTDWGTRVGRHARPDEDRFLIVFPQEYGHYLWEVVVDAAGPLGGGPAA